MRRGFAIAAVLGLACSLLQARQGHAQGPVTAVGRVVDGEGNPIRDVEVLLEYRGHIVQKYRTKTDRTGKFIHLSVYEGPYHITLTKEGIGTVSFDYDIQELSSTQKPPEFKLMPKPAAAPPPPGSGLAPARPAAGGASPVNLGKLEAETNAAAALAGQGKVDEAVAAYEAIAVEAPQIPLVHHNLAGAYKRKGDAAKAEAAYRKAIELDPRFVDGYVGLATLLAEGGKRGQAIEAITQGVAQNEQSGRLQYALGVLEVGAGDNKAAREALLKAESLDPQNNETQYQLATVALNMNDRAEAVARLERFVAAAAPDNPNIPVAKSLLAALQKK
jgi:Tfp pilus assembly protein PilF